MDYEIGIRLERIEQLLTYLVNELEKDKNKDKPKKGKENDTN